MPGQFLRPAAVVAIEQVRREGVRRGVYKRHDTMKSVVLPDPIRLWMRPGA